MTQNELSALIPCFIDHVFLVSDFRQLPCRDFLQFLHSFSTAAFASGIVNAWRIGMNLCTRLSRVTEVIPFLQCCDLDKVSVQLLLALVSCFRRHQQYVFCHVFPGTSNFLRAAFTVSLNSASFGSMKNIPLNCLALSSFGFSIAHLCFVFSSSVHQTYASTYLATHWLGDRLFVSS